VFKEELFNRVGYLQGANLLPNFLELAEQKIEKEGACPSVFTALRRKVHTRIFGRHIKAWCKNSDQV